MKRRGLFALGFFLLSTTALMPVYHAAAKNTQDGQEGRQVDLVKPLSSWKVGTVSSGGNDKPYCAMVGTFERGMVLAIAKNDKGMGSLAVDFKDPIFESNVRYPVWVDLEGGVSKELQGVASSDRSLVVQFGKDERFYKSLTRTSRLDISTPDVDVSFTLSQALNGSRKLDGCAAQLVEAAAGDVSESQEISDNPVDQEATRLTAENEELQKARDEVARLKSKLASTEKYDDIDAEISRRMAEHEQRYQARIAELEVHETQLQAQIDQRKNDLSLSEQAGKKSADATKQVERLEAEKQGLTGDLEAMTRQNKLLQAALEDKANELKKMSQSGGAQDAKVASVQRELDGLDKSSAKQIAQLSAALQQKNTEYDALSQQLAAEKQKGGAELPSDLAKSYKSQIAGFEKQLAEAKTMRETEKQRADQVQAELSSARAEIASLKQALPAEQQRVASLQSSLDQKQAALDRQAKVQSEEAKRLDERRAELEKMRGDIADNQYQGTLETRGKVQELLSKPSVSSVQLSSVQAELTRKQADLERQAQSQKTEAEWLESERARLEQMKATMKTADIVSTEKGELEGARGRIAELEKNYQQATTRIAELETSLKTRLSGQTVENQKHLADLGKREAELVQREQELTTKETELGQKLAMLDKQPAKTEVIWQKEAVADTATTEALKAAQAELVTERQKLVMAQADVTRLQQIITGDQQKIASLQAELADKTATVASVTGKTDERVAQLSAENSRLQDQLKGKEVAEAEVTRLQGIITQNQAQIDGLNRARQETVALTAPVSHPSPEDAARVAELERKIAEQAEQLAAKAEAAAPQRDDARVAELEQKLREQSALLSTKEQEISAIKMMAAVQPSAALATAVGSEAPRTDTTAITASDTGAAVATTASTDTATSSDTATSTGGGWKKFLGFGNDTKKDSGVWSYAPVKSAKPVATVATAPVVTQDPVVTNAPVFQTNTMDKMDTNKAAAFLEGIMASHRPSGSGLRKSEVVEPVGFSPEMDVEPASGDESASDFDALSSRNVDVATKTDTAKTGDASTASTATAPVAVASYLPPVKQPVTTTQIAIAVPVDGVESIATPMTSSVGSLNVRSILATSGITTDSFTQGDPAEAGSDGFTYYQWTAGELNGLFEQSSWSADQSFESMVESYIDRYREDCPAQLTASIGAYKTQGGQSLVDANVSCNMTGNSYVTSFVFQGGAGTFSAILHTGFPDARGKVLSAGEHVFGTLRDHGGKITASGAGYGVTPSTTGKEFDLDSFETVYVQ